MRPPSFWNFLRLAQEFDDFLQLFFGFLYAGHILEGDLFLLHGKQPGAALAEGQRLVAAGLHLPDHEEPQGCEQDQRRPGSQQLERPTAAGDIADIHGDALITQRLDHVGIVRRGGGMKRGIIIPVLAAYLLASDGDLFHVALVHIRQEL